MASMIDSVPSWALPLVSAISGLFGAGIVAGRYGTRLDHVEGDVHSLKIDLREDINQLRADVREAINRGPNCRNFSPRD